jgi:fatty acid desaturase
MKQNNANDLNLTITSSELKPLFKKEVYRHVLAMIYDWTLIVLSIYLCLSFFNPISYFIAVLIIGSRMHALAILMHDATHYRFLNNRQWSDFVTNVFTMYPLFTNIDNYRNNHLRHHRHLNSEHDPDWVAKLGVKAFTFPKTKSKFLLTILSYLTLYRGLSDAIWFFKRFQNPKKGEKQAKDKKQLIFVIILFAILTIGGWWKYYLLFWVVPYLSTFFMFQYIRSVAEHFGELEYDHLLNSTRTVRPNWLERFLLAPHNVGYHLEHHLYPGVPFYNLGKLHHLLMRDQEYNQKAHITIGYVRGLFDELSKSNNIINS